MQPKKKILLVEDDSALASVYKSRLELEGFEVAHVANGELALSTAIQFKPDLIVLDAMMPKINGFDVLDILRNTPETTNVHGHHAHGTFSAFRQRARERAWCR